MTFQELVPLKELLDNFWNESAALREDPANRRLAPIFTGFTDLDELLGGLQRSAMTILAASPGMGKSALALNIACNAAKTGAVVVVFSLEMSRKQVVTRLLSSEAGVDAHRLGLRFNTEAEETRILKGVGCLSGLPIYIDDSPMQSIAQISSEAHRLHEEQGVDLIIVDSLQQLIRREQPEGKRRPTNRMQELSVTTSLKEMARDLNASVVAVSQLSRAVVKRHHHHPILSDLGESGSIEQNADTVVFIYRDDYYYTEDEWGAMEPDRPYLKGLAEISVAKNRNGRTGITNLYFRADFARFENL